MKQTLILSVLFLSAFTVSAQITSLSENFNTSCPATTTFVSTGSDFSKYNTVTTSAGLQWDCTATGGRGATPGVEVSSYISGIFYKDSAWLFTPQLLLSGYPGNIYLRFDSKYLHYAGRMSVLVSSDYHKYQNPDTAATWTDVTSAGIPAIDPHDDSANWVTHQIDLTPFKATPIYVAFKYTSTVTSGGTWTLDNILTTTSPLYVEDPTTSKMHLAILGASTSDKITFRCASANAGTYDVALYDNLGREVHKEKVQAQAGVDNFTMSGLNLHPGMYILKVGKGSDYSVVKTIVE